MKSKPAITRSRVHRTSAVGHAVHWFAGFLVALLLESAPASAATLASPSVVSPDGAITVSLHWPADGSKERPQWSASFHGRPLLSHCELGIRTAASGELFAGARPVQEQKRNQDEQPRIPFGKADHANDRFQEVRYTVQSGAGPKLDVVIRCYNDAIALRYELPATGEETGPVTVTEESTSFGIEGDPTAYVQYLPNYRTSHEHPVTAIPWREIRQGELLDLPLTLSWKDQTSVAFTEASLRNYAGMALAIDGDDATGLRLVSRLTPRADGSKVVRPLPLLTPWRVVLIADHPGALLESTTLYCLNLPTRIPDLSWIRPGKITFSWWNGDVYDGKPGPPILSFDMAKRYIDFCGENGIPTHSMTSMENTVTPWYRQSSPGVTPGPDTDVTHPRDGFELARIKQYADKRKVRLWTWVHQGALRGRVEEAFTAFEAMGWSGMMVDFFDHDDQETVEFAESILDSAARHHIQIHLHGIWKPTGLERTYPNLMNHEGALNLEYLKWSNLCTPEHNLNMAFTRLIAGPMDYHLGGFRAVTRADFKPLNVAPNVLGTRCHHLAMYVCFDNPNPMLADYPTAYVGQPGFDFLKIVPTWWDETRALDGKIGELLITARRKGRTWYVGGMSARTARDLKLPLLFLEPGRYNARLWRDAKDSERNPNHLESHRLNVTRNDTLNLHLALDGGFVAEIDPMAKP